jgi:RNA polymerase sigma-70 factor (ECF subfamily)
LGPAATPSIPNPGQAVFVRERRRLLSVAYGFLGSLAEAEDVLQDAYLRLEQVDFDTLHEPEAWLTTVVSRLALDQLRSARHRRETYPGEWLPEPIFDAPLAEQNEITRSRLSVAFLHLLEKLKPEERAVFVLREVFEYSYREIGAMLSKSEAACRQTMTRARARLETRKPPGPDEPPETPLEANESPRTSDLAEMRPLVERFVSALTAGDEQALLEMLAPGAVLYGDGGGKVQAVVNPIYGAERIVRFFAGLTRKYAGRFSQSVATINSEPGFMTLSDGELSSMTAVACDDGRITHLYAVLNPDKLSPDKLGRGRPRDAR